jgi:hypothetical protein
VPQAHTFSIECQIVLRVVAVALARTYGLLAVHAIVAALFDVDAVVGREVVGACVTSGRRVGAEGGGGRGEGGARARAKGSSDSAGFH